MKDNSAITPRKTLFDYLLAVPLGCYLGIIAALVLSVFLSITGEAFLIAVRESAIMHAVKLSLGTSMLSTSLAVVIAVPAGYVLSRYEFIGKTVVDTLLDMPIVLPPLVMGLSVLIFFNTTVGGAIEEVIEFIYTWRGIVLVQVIVGGAFAVRVVKAGFDATPASFEQVSMVLGADRVKTFFKVTLPMVKQSIVAGAVISWARIFGLFGPILLVSGTMRNRTEIMPTTIFLETSIGRMEVALVIASMMILLSCTMLVVFKRLGGKGYLW